MRGRQVQSKGCRRKGSKNDTKANNQFETAEVSGKRVAKAFFLFRRCARRQTEISIRHCLEGGHLVGLGKF